MRGAYIKKDLNKDGINWDVMEDEDRYDVFHGRFRGDLPDARPTPVTSPSWCGCRNPGPILLTFDAVYTQDHWDQKCLPGALTSARDTAASVRRLRRLAEMKTRCVFGHDMEACKTFKKLRRRTTTNRLGFRLRGRPERPPAAYR